MMQKLLFNAVLIALVDLRTHAWAEPDKTLFGKSQNHPTGSANTWYSNPNRVAAWSPLRIVQGIKTPLVDHAADVNPLPKANQQPAIAYRYRNIGYTLAKYLECQRATGFLKLKNSEIVTENDRYGRKDDARFLSFFMSKSIMALLVRAALIRGQIASLDNTAETYVKALASSPYSATTVQQLLPMSSSLTFAERYDGSDDMARLSRASGGVRGAGTPTDVLCSIADRHLPAGQKFIYTSAETDVLGLILTATTGKNLGELTQAWLWQPLGAEHDDYWLIVADGQAQAYGAFNASLRDWARLVLMLAKDGKVNRKVGSQQIIAGEASAQCNRPGAPARGLQATQGHALLWLRLLVLVDADERAHICHAGHSWPDGLRSANNWHRDGIGVGLGVCWR